MGASDYTVNFDRKKETTPSSNMVGMTQRPWTPTKRRGPIAAEYSSPGPACVTLPPLIGKYCIISILSIILFYLSLYIIIQDWEVMCYL